MTKSFMNPDLSIIIVNYNTRQMTGECIDSIFHLTTGITFEIIVVDNASTDGSYDLLSNDKRIIYIYNQENVGFGRANNLGIKIAKGRNIIFLNSDTLLQNDALSILSNYLDSNPAIGAVGGNLIDADGKPALSFQRLRPSITWELNLLSLGILSRLLYGRNRTYNFTHTPINTGYISGADLMVKKSVLDKIGTFSPEFFMYYEETDLCARIARAGYKIQAIPDAVIMHLEGKSFSDKNGVNQFRIKTQEESREIYYRRNYSQSYHKIANAIYTVTLTIQPYILSLFGKKNQSQIVKYRKYARK